MDNKIIEKAVKQFETPFYLYDRDIIRKQNKKLRETIPSNSSLYYSIKANPLIGLCQFMRTQTDGTEVSSKGELYIALKAGVSPNNIVFSGPGKTDKELEYAIDNNIKLINVESLKEMELINEISEARNKITPIAIRVNPSDSHSNARIKMSGVSSQFGVEETELNKLFFESVRKLKYVQLMGVQVYTGTQNLDSESLTINIKYIISLALKLSNQYRFELKYLNLGGGFGVPYFSQEKELDMDKLKTNLIAIFEQYCNELRGTEIIFESGRYLMAEAGVFVVKILYAKESKGSHYLICNGGSNFHSASAFLGRFVRSNFPMYVLNKEEQDKVYTVTGSLCTPTDVIGQDVKLDSRSEIGDYIIIEKSGAYGLTNSPSEFLSHENPMEIIYADSKFYILREKVCQQYKQDNQNDFNVGVINE